ncbi:MAG: aspartate/glutamate racemase family protein [Sphingobacteriales bacterium]|nr:aspartate/glutamate racemase family protein [Sphingobacteriales bacterium]
MIESHINTLLGKAKNIDTILLACTHYPLLINKIKQFVPNQVTIISQGEIVAKSLENYLNNHPQIDANSSKTGKTIFYTTGSTQDFDYHAATFFGKPVKSIHLEL